MDLGAPRGRMWGQRAPKVEYSARIMLQGPARSLGCAVLLATLAAWPALARADAATTEYADAQYRFTFRFPTDWQREQVPASGEGGEVRLAAKSAARPIFVLSIVSPSGPAITREEFERRPDRDALVEELIRRTLGQVYAKMSRDLSASRLGSTRRSGKPPTRGSGSPSILPTRPPRARPPLPGPTSSRSASRMPSA